MLQQASAIRGHSQMTKRFNRFIDEENGATAIEYGLIATFIALGIVGSISLLAPAINAVFALVVGAI